MTGCRDVSSGGTVSDKINLVAETVTDIKNNQYSLETFDRTNYVKK